MKILFDHQIFERQSYGGISRYYSELISRLSNDYDVKTKISLDNKNNIHLESHKNSDFWYLSEKKNISPIDAAKNQLKEILGKPKKSSEIANSCHWIEKGDFDIFHPTYYNPYFLQKLGNKPFVLTVYDMIHEIFPESFDHNEKIIEWKKELLEQAEMIITISETTKNDILSFYELDPAKIEAIPLSDSYENYSINPQSEAILNFPQKYLLYVGNRNLYKNFYFLIESLAPLLKKENITVVCAGGPNFSEMDKYFMDIFNVGSRFIHININDEILAQLYQHAEGFIFPSLYEGFGLPILEAFHWDCPVIASNGGALPEIGGDAAVYFNPKNPSDLREATQLVLFEEQFKNSLIKKGKRRLTEFSWDETVKRTYNVYSGIAKI